MSGRADALAERFQRATEEVVRFVEGLSDAQWRAVDTDEGLSIGAMVHPWPLATVWPAASSRR